MNAPPGQQAQAPAPPGGYPPQTYGQVPVPVKKDETLALASIIAAAVAWLMQLHIFAAIPAVICGHMQKKNIKRDPERYGGDGMATAGIVLGWIDIVLSLLLIAFFVFMFVGIPVLMVLLQVVMAFIVVLFGAVGA